MRRMISFATAAVLALMLAGCATSAPASRDHYTLKLTIETTATADSTTELCRPDLFAGQFSGGAATWAQVKGGGDTRYGETALDAGTLTNGKCVFQATLEVEQPVDNQTYVYVEQARSDENLHPSADIYADYVAPSRAEDSLCNISVKVSIPRNGSSQDGDRSESYPADCRN